MDLIIINLMPNINLGHKCWETWCKQQTYAMGMVCSKLISLGLASIIPRLQHTVDSSTPSYYTVPGTKLYLKYASLQLSSAVCGRHYACHIFVRQPLEKSTYLSWSSCVFNSRAHNHNCRLLWKFYWESIQVAIKIKMNP